MGMISAKLRSVTRQDGAQAIAFFCPGCKEVHVVYHTGKIAWHWNGNVDKPTLQPSIRIYTPATIHPGEAPKPEKTLCHCFVRDGDIQFLTDCAHELAGQTVPIPDWPYAKGAYGGIDE